MNRIRLFEGLGVLSIAGGSIAIWYAFQRQMCTVVAGGTNQCAPNIAYLIPGMLAALAGISLVVFLHRRNRPDDPPKAGT